MNISALLGYINNLVAQGGPEPSEFFELLAVFDELQSRKDEASKLVRACIEQSDGSFNSVQTMQGHVCLQPYGYHGDFHIIDRIYTNDVALNPSLARWDEFFHWGTAAVAVRNRKTFFITHCLPRLLSQQNTVRMLNVGSGPCRDVAELLSHSEHLNVQIECLDSDERAFAYARNVVGLVDPRVQFVHKNALRHGGHARYDIIWSAGLFDYLHDALFVTLARRLSRLLCTGGELIIGNFSQANTQAGYMAFGGWDLNHRSADHLMGLAAKAGFDLNSVNVLQEPSGVNFFIQIRPKIAS